ncbi:MAG: shikimate kinase [Acholeplasmataceae bacterium]|nr:shikimate kinase [Acholeplasmataceae bacterium]
MKLYLIGMPLSGKSIIGQEVAEQLNLQFVDLDHEIEQIYQTSIEDIFKEEGEEAFRTYETLVLASYKDKENLVVSTGGGIIKRQVNKALMNGLIIYIDTDIEILEERGNQSYKRPLLQKTSLYDLYNERVSLYEAFKTHKIENNGLVEEAVNNILKIVRTEK